MGSRSNRIEISTRTLTPVERHDGGAEARVDLQNRAGQQGGAGREGETGRARVRQQIQAREAIKRGGPYLGHLVTLGVALHDVVPNTEIIHAWVRKVVAIA